MKTIYFISDNPVLLKLWEFLLTREGHKVVTGTEIDTFKDLMLEEKPDVLLVDSFMGHTEGFELCYSLKEDPKFKSIPIVIFVTSYNLISSLERSKGLCDAYWIKYDFRPRTLCHKIYEILGEKKKPNALEDTVEIERLLKESGIFTQEQIERADRYHKDNQNISFMNALLESGAVIGETMNCLNELQFKVDYVDLDKIKPSEAAVAIMGRDSAINRKAVPLYLKHNVLTVAMAEPWEIPDIDYISQQTKCLVQTCYAPADKIDRAIMSAYSGREFREQAQKIMVEDLKNANKGFIDGSSLEEIMDEQPVIDFLNSIIFEAIKSRASDIHIEYTDVDVLIRYRIDGVLHDIQNVPSRMGTSLIACLKIMGEMDIVERRLPQDGRFKMKIQEHEVDFRVSTVPLSTGEKVVIRVLSRTNMPTNHADLGMDSKLEIKYKDVVSQPHGMVLITGPTGSGKTTTLYATLNYLMSPEKNIISIEDPVEYFIKRVNQIQVNTKIGLTFASILRHVLRQDPDIVMVGEIRDFETAELAAQASLTGHIVLGTLHTNDAPTGLIRLVDMGLPPFIVASTVNSIVAQRLMRRICPNCKTEMQLNDESKRKLAIDKHDLEMNSFYNGSGCSLCRKTGYQGRIGIFELLNISDKIRSIVMANADFERISKQAREEGMTTLREAAWDMVTNGVSTLDEMWRVTRTENY